jgi:hypothetical protein
VLHPPAGSGQAYRPLMLPIRRTPLSAYNNLATVDLGNDGVAPIALFDGDGNALAQVGPQGLGVTWALDQCVVSSSIGALDAALASVFAGPLAIPTYLVASSLAGGGSQFALGGLGVAAGWFVWAQWTGGTPGAQAYLRVTGQKSAPVPG